MKQDIAVIATIGITLLGGIVLSVIPSDNDKSDYNVQTTQEHELIEPQKSPSKPLIHEEPDSDIGLPKDVEAKTDEQSTESQQNGSVKTEAKSAPTNTSTSQPEQPQQPQPAETSKDPWTITKTVTKPLYDRLTGFPVGWNCEYYLEAGVIAFFHSGIPCWTQGEIIEKPYRERTLQHYTNWWK